jgi:PAS domain S-box-containing protein
MKNRRSTSSELKDESTPRRLQARPRKAVEEDQQVTSSRVERSEGLFRGLTENGLDSVAVLDKKGRVMYLSPSVERIWNRRSAEFGKDPFGLVHPSEHARVSTGYARALRQPGVPLRAEYRVSHADGSWRTIETVTTNMLSDPSIRGVVVSFRDITQRKLAEERLKESEAELRLLSQEIFKVAAEASRSKRKPQNCWRCRSRSRATATVS